MAERVILVVDDEQAQRTVLAGFLRKRGFEVVQASSVSEGLDAVSARTIDLVLTDLRMPGASGLDLLQGVRRVNPEIPVVVMTAFGTVASAVDAMKRGAADYLTKPIDLDELEVLLGRTLERRALVSENRELRRQVESRYRLAGLETANARMAEAINVAGRAAGSRATILRVRVRTRAHRGSPRAGARRPDARRPCARDERAAPALQAPQVRPAGRAGGREGLTLPVPHVRSDVA